MDKYLGSVLSSRYEILEIIGNGGMSVVYKARDLRLNRLVAIKILKDDAFADEELRLRFRTESEAVAQLNHPNIVNIFDVSSTDDMEYIVMELIDGITLHQYMKKRGTLPMKEVLFFVSQILKALDHAHSRNIVHRDIKPQNMMLLRDGTLKVTDFGIARITSKQKTLTNNAFGSVHYIAPEQARGEQTDGRTDIYSVGVILYEMLTGRLPFEGDSPLAIAIQHLNSTPIPPSGINPDIPKSFEGIVMKAMSVMPEQRYSNAMSMLADFEEFKANPNMTVRQEIVDDEPEFETKKIEKLTGLEGGEAVEAAAAGKEEKMAKRTQKKRSRFFPGGVAAPVIAGIVTTVLLVSLAVTAVVWAFSSGGTNNVTLPKLEGMTLVEAQSYLAADSRFANLNIVCESERNDSTVPKGQIIEMKPKSGTVVRDTSTVNVVVSLGPLTVLLNDISGKTAIEGTNALKTYLASNGLYGLSYQNKYESSDTFAKDTIIRTEPEAGKEVKAGDIIYIVISSGPDIEEIPMPYLVGLDVEAAKSLLSDNKLTCEIIEQYSDLPVGTVIMQSVAKDAMIAQTSVVQITVSKGLEPDTPDDPTPGGSVQTTYVFNVEIPAHSAEYSVKIVQDGNAVYNNTHGPEAEEVSAILVGPSGSTANVVVLVNDSVWTTETVNFR